MPATYSLLYTALDEDIVIGPDFIPFEHYERFDYENDSVKSDTQMKRAPKARKRTATQVSDLYVRVDLAPERQDTDDIDGNWP
jgi:hypothetical protein